MEETLALTPLPNMSVVICSERESHFIERDCVCVCVGERVSERERERETERESESETKRVCVFWCV